MPYKRKTRDTWQFWVHYGTRWEHDTTELTHADMVMQRKCYRADCPYPLRIKRVREPIAHPPRVLITLARDPATGGLRVPA